MSIEVDLMDIVLGHKESEENNESEESNFENIIDDLKIYTEMTQVTQVTQITHISNEVVQMTQIVVKTSLEPVNAVDAIDAVDDEFQNMLNDLKVIKKKKKKKEVETVECGCDDKSEKVKKYSAENEVELYRKHLSNIYRQLEKNNPDLMKRRTSSVPIPIVHKPNGDKVIIMNFGNISKAINRDPQHIKMYLESELSTITTLNENKLTIKGVFRPAYIQTMLSKYIGEHVTCLSCKSINTKITKIDRLTFIVCNICNCSRTQQPIKKGFTALTKYTK